jgi:thiol-disulfide isomerase/thioredoxin
MRFLAFFLCASLLSACSEQFTTTGNRPGNPALEDFHGQWVVVNYWAKWCKPCIKEIPELNALNRDYPQVNVLGVNYDGASGEQLATQIQELKIGFPILASDPAVDLGLSRPVVLPTTLILNRAGEVTEILVGPQTLESLLAVTVQSESSTDS